VNGFIALLLAQDGLTNGAIYALLALVLVMVFSITRIILVPQGEIVSYAALTLATLQAHRLPGTVYLLIAGGAVVAIQDLWTYLTTGRPRGRLVSALVYFAVPLAIAVIIWGREALGLPDWTNFVLTLAVIVPLGPILYRVIFAPIAGASVLVLLIVAVALHLAMVGFGLLIFGPEGVRVPPLVTARIPVAGFMLSGQTCVVLAVTAALIVLLFLFFGLSLEGKALRATTFNRIGARLVGIDTSRAGMLAFFLAALIGAVSGILISSVTTIYYDTGFLIGLKGFVAAILGGLASYPLAGIGALLIGLLESFSSFWASAFKEVIVFGLIIPILLLRNLTAKTIDEEEEE
jgi:branched-chain amino acid transport system permease protein